MREHAYLIIGGTPKAGTTSLFRYLADHPRVCASNIKETCFFLDPDYPRTAKYRLEDGLDKYDVYFNHCRGRSIRLEATPAYLYSPGTPQRIKRSLPNAKLIFILREPIERLVSSYRFAIQNNVLSEQVNFEEYVHLQVENQEYDQVRPPHLRALEEGRYSIFLKPFIENLGRDRIHVLQQADLKSDPLKVLESVCQFGAIDPSFYQDYDFEIFHQTQAIRNKTLHKIYMRSRRVVRGYVHDKKSLRPFLRFIRRRLIPFYFRWNRAKEQEIVITESLESFLRSYYDAEPQALEELLGENFTW